MANYTKKAVKGTGIVFILSVFTAGISYLVRLLFARNLTIAEYGLFYSIIALIGLLSIFKDMGIGKALVKFIPEFIVKKDEESIRNSIISVFLIQGTIYGFIILMLILSSNFLGEYYFHNIQASFILKIVAIGFLIDSIAYVLSLSFQGFQMTTYTAGIDFFRMSIILIITFILFRLNIGLNSVAFAYLIAPIILAIIFIPIFLKTTRAFKKFSFNINKKLIKKLFGYGLWLIALSAGSMVLSYTDTLVLTYFSGLEKVGLYNVAIPTAKLLMYMTLSIGVVLFPLVSELWAKKQIKLLKEGANLLYKYSSIIIIPSALTMFSFPSIVLNLFFGSRYIEASSALRILSIGVVFFTLANINTSILIGMGKAKTTSKIFFIAAVFNFTFNMLLIPKFHIVGAASTTVMSYIIILVLTQISLKRAIKLDVPLKLWLKNILLAFIFIFVIIILKKILVMNAWLEMLIVVLIASIIYISMLFLLKIISFNELKILKSRIFG